MPAVEVYQAIADPTRRRILDLLAESDQPVTAIAAPFPVSRPAISQHLRVLRQAGLVTEQRLGRHRHYRLLPDRLRDVNDWLAGYQRFWAHRMDALRAYVEENE